MSSSSSAAAAASASADDVSVASAAPVCRCALPPPNSPTSGCRVCVPDNQDQCGSSLSTISFGTPPENVPGVLENETEQTRGPGTSTPRHTSDPSRPSSCSGSGSFEVTQSSSGRLRRRKRRSSPSVEDDRKRALLKRSESSCVLNHAREELPSHGIADEHDDTLHPSRGLSRHFSGDSDLDGGDAVTLNRTRSTGCLELRFQADGSGQFCALPIVRFGDHGQNQTTAQAVASLLQDRRMCGVFDLHIIDCRYPFEFNGGHISGALNFPHHGEVISYLKAVYRRRKSQERELGCSLPKEVILFYCEFSSVRAPQCYRRVRSWDRASNERYYPNIYFPEMYLVSGGYKGFFEKFPHLCEPRSYVTMRSNQPEASRWLQMVSGSASSQHRRLERLKRRPFRPLIFDECEMSK